MVNIEPEYTRVTAIPLNQPQATLPAINHNNNTPPPREHFIYPHPPRPYIFASGTDPDLIAAASALANVAVAVNSGTYPQRQEPTSVEKNNNTAVQLSAERAVLPSPRVQLSQVRPLTRKRKSPMMDAFLRERGAKSLKPDVGGVSGEEVDMEPEQGPEDLANSRQMFESNVESPSSPLGTYKGARDSCCSDDGNSSIMDMEDMSFMDPDSVPGLIAELKRVIAYAQSKSSLYYGSASFMRDHLRTLLSKNSIAVADARQTKKKAAMTCASSGLDGVVECSKKEESFKNLPDELAKHIFSYMDGRQLAQMRTVCRKWDQLGSEDALWKKLCTKKWRSLETDLALWGLVYSDVAQDSPTKWRQIYPKVSGKTRWKCKLMKTGRFICNLSAHQLSGTPLGEDGLPPVLIVERRFNMLHLRTFVLPEASVLYFEPHEDVDKNGFKDFIDYLIKRTRAGLALEEQRRFIFIPPCDYTKSYVGYAGSSLIGVVQNAYPPLAPA